MISKAQAQVLAFLSALLVGSSSETEKSVRETHFSRRAGIEHEALPLMDHSHDLEALVADAVGSILNPSCQPTGRSSAKKREINNIEPAQYSIDDCPQDRVVL